MKIKIDENKKLVDVLNKTGTIVKLGNGVEYKFLPFWYEFSEDGVYEHSLGENLPKDLTDFINIDRGIRTVAVKQESSAFVFTISEKAIEHTNMFKTTIEVETGAFVNKEFFKEFSELLNKYCKQQ